MHFSQKCSAARAALRKQSTRPKWRAAAQAEREQGLTANRSSRQDLPTPLSPISSSCMGAGRGGAAQGAREGAAIAKQVNQLQAAGALGRSAVD